MKMKQKMMKLSIFVVLVLTGLLVMANAINYKQTSCEYVPNDRYIWIKLDNGIQPKGVRFVSDGVIFDSSLMGMTYAKDYPDIIQVIYGQGKEAMGLLSVEFTEDGQLEREDVGNIDESCWENLQTLLSANPASQHIKQVELKVSE